jgi:hypothetical protein
MSEAIERGCIVLIKVNSANLYVMEREVCDDYEKYRYTTDINKAMFMSIYQADGVVEICKQDFKVASS